MTPAPINRFQVFAHGRLLAAQELHQVVGLAIQRVPHVQLEKATIPCLGLPLAFALDRRSFPEHGSLLDRGRPRPVEGDRSTTSHPPPKRQEGSVYLFPRRPPRFIIRFMPLARNEIHARAVAFARHWSDPAHASRERPEAQTFWNEFFDVFGVSRRKVASFEEPVKNLKGDTEFIDLLWKGRLLAEHKSRGKDLSKAHTQAIGYIQDLINQNRGEEVPRYVLVSDFARFALHDRSC